MGRKRRRLESHATLLVLLTVLSCDTFKEDFIAGKQVTFSKTEYYVLPASSVIIDLESAVKQSYTNASLQISRNPSRGTLSHLGTLLLKYDADREFPNGYKDQFDFSVLSDGNVIATETMTIFMKADVEQLPCTIYAVEDNAHVKSGSMVSVSLLKNDRICGVTDLPLQISIHLNPQFGESRLVGDSVIVYTPGPEYSGRDQLVYKLADTSGENFSYGIVNISEWGVQFFPTPPRRSQLDSTVPELTKMFFVNDTTGFLGGYGIYKTTDGGAHWKASYPVTVDNVFNITDFYFLDADHGYASYQRYEGSDYEGGFLSTVDGGDNWTIVVPYRQPVFSVFFTSSTTGFATVLDWLDGPAELPYTILLKTDDGGRAWKRLFSTRCEQGTLTVRFADSKTGYAYHRYTVFRTIDGGESWKSVVENKYIISAAILPDNIINANITSGGLLETSPSTMLRSTDGDNWNPTINFPHTILAQGFSPSGNTGFAIGISGTNPSSLNPRSQTLSLNESVDKGATWTEVEVTESLYGYPLAMALPSDKVAYVLFDREIIKFTRP
jgi:hypothetical protein